MEKTKKERMLVEGIAALRQKIDECKNVDKILELRKELSLLLYKKEVIENRLRGKFYQPQKQYYTIKT
jgi:hypothetical protein